MGFQGDARSMPHIAGGVGVYAGAGSPGVARELADKIRAAEAVILRRCRRWTLIEIVKECGKLLSECLRGIPI